MKKYNIILVAICVLVIFFNAMYYASNNMAGGIRTFKNYVEVELVNFNNNTYSVEAYNDGNLIEEFFYYLPYSDEDTIKCILVSNDTYKENDELKVVITVKKNDGVTIDRKINLKQHTENNFAYEFDCDTGTLSEKEARKWNIPKYPTEKMFFYLKVTVYILNIIFVIYLVFFFKKLVKYLKEKENVKVNNNNNNK